MEIKKYVHKPTKVTVMRWTGKNVDDIKKWLGKAFGSVKDDELHVRTLEDGKNNEVKHIATKGDFIIQGVKGEFWPIKSDIMKATYQLDEIFGR